MKSIVLAVLAAMFVAGAAYAVPGNGNQGECPGNSCHGGDANVDVDVDTDVVTVTDVDVDVKNTNVNNAVAVSEQEQSQGQFQAQGNAQSLTIEDAKNPASSAANLYLANCTSGASGQGFGGGGSIGGPDEVCLLMNYAQVSAMLGDAEGSVWAMKEARNILKVRTNSFLRIFQALPIVRRIF